MEMHEDLLDCPVCGGRLQEVRPGKHQCDFCETTEWHEWKSRWVAAKNKIDRLTVFAEHVRLMQRFGYIVLGEEATTLLDEALRDEQ